MADPVGMNRKSCLYTILEYCALVRLSSYTDWISCVHLPQFPRLTFYVLIYIQLLIYGPQHNSKLAA